MIYNVRPGQEMVVEIGKEKVIVPPGRYTPKNLAFEISKELKRRGLKIKCKWDPIAKVFYDAPIPPRSPVNPLYKLRLSCLSCDIRMIRGVERQNVSIEAATWIVSYECPYCFKTIEIHHVGPGFKVKKRRF